MRVPSSCRDVYEKWNFKRVLHNNFQNARNELLAANVMTAECHWRALKSESIEPIQWIEVRSSDVSFRKFHSIA